MANMQVLLKQVAKKLASLLKFPIFFKTFIPKNTYEKFHLKGIQVVQLRSVYKALWRIHNFFRNYGFYPVNISKGVTMDVWLGRKYTFEISSFMTEVPINGLVFMW